MTVRNRFKHLFRFMRLALTNPEKVSVYETRAELLVAKEIYHQMFVMGAQWLQEWKKETTKEWLVESKAIPEINLSVHANTREEAVKRATIALYQAIALILDQPEQHCVTVIANDE